MRANHKDIFIGVDVGTGSARAGIFDATGHLLARARHPIQTWYLPGDIVEQSSDDVWSACVQAVRGALRTDGIDAARVAGIGFDATCSLVVVDAAGEPVTVSPSGEQRRNIIVWMDHRAAAEAAEINATGEDVLRYVGGMISPEMQTPKLLWLRRHLPHSYARAAHFLDLADYLTFRATGSTTRSRCTVTCKWTYLPNDGGWNRSYFHRIGLDDLLSDHAARIGAHIVAPGTALAEGLTDAAACELGVPSHTPVGAALIDGHAGALGTIGSRDADDAPVAPTWRVAYILGTSACVMATTPDPCFVPGIWGPYASAILDDCWLNEGGQSAAGCAIDTLVRSHPCHAQASADADKSAMELLPWLEQRILARVATVSDAARLARGLHVVPDYLGNRSPDADPAARAMIAGLTIDHAIEGLEALFVAGLCGLGYGLALIIDALRARGVRVDSVIISGGASQSRLVRQLLADATGVPIHLAATDEPVLLGSAMLGGVASGFFRDLPAAMSAMSSGVTTTATTTVEIAAFHAAKRRVFERMKALDRTIRQDMESIVGGG